MCCESQTYNYAQGKKTTLVISHFKEEHIGLMVTLMIVWELYFSKF